MNALLPSIFCAFSSMASAQEPAAPPSLAPVVATTAGVRSEGFGRASTYRAALAGALEDAVAKVKGVQITRGGSLQERLAIVARHPAGGKEGWFDGSGDGERDWVQQQIAGFVSTYEVTKREKAADGQWEVTVVATVAVLDDGGASIVIDLADDGLRKWQLERFEDGASSAAFARQNGEYSGPGVADNLRRSRSIEIVGKGPRVAVGDGVAPGEREKLNHLVVASHRVVVQWSAIAVQSSVEKPNVARPSNGPRPEYLTGGSVSVVLRIDDLVRGVEVMRESFTVPADVTPAYGVDRLDAFVNALADKAKAAVAEKVYFALRPPFVLRKWPGDKAGQWLIEVQVARRVAVGFQNFAVGNDGSLASPDWQPIGRATLVGGTETSCTFRIDDLSDASAIEPNVTQIRPLDQ